jgi:hypothetical protein
MVIVQEECSLSEDSRTDDHDGDRTGRSSTSGMVVNTECVEELIFENRRIAISNLIGALMLSIGTQNCPRKKELGLHRVKMLKLSLKWDKRISVFPEYNEK